MPDFKSRLDAALSHRYQLERELGRGGMATVWLARDLRHGRRVALKVLHPELAATLGPDRFLREIEIAASLAHPNILPLHESGEADGYLYYVMPYVEGESLRDRLRREIQLPIEDAIRIAREVADALGYAHGHRLIHRDIKPENILLEAGHAVVADFGVARAIETAGSDLLTATGLVVGTPAYMSPEQAGGSDRLDGRSDLYSLGCVLYEMLAGEPPFSAPTPQALAAKHLHAPAPRIEVTRATVPRVIAEALDRAMAKVPADRFGTAQEFARVLAGVRQDALTSRARGPRPKARRVAAAAAALAGTVGIGLWVGRSPDGRPLDANRVVVFPLREQRNSPSRGQGEAVATYIGYALEGSEPLKWIEAWDRLSEGERSGVQDVTPEVAADITRREGARYYIEGSIVPLQDSIAVVLRLRDVLGDSLIKRVGAAGLANEVILPQLGVHAVAQLLPSLLEPGRKLDLAVLSERKPAAIAAFLQGERAYRRMQFEQALQHYQVALRADSSLVLAALKGAQAAQWKELPDVAERLNSIALTKAATLPPRYAEFSRGLRAYLRGDADSALWHFDLALQVDSTWVEAWMGRGEVFFHLLPVQSPPDSLARASMLAAERLDSTFSPSLLHLAHLSLREGDTARASVLLGRLRATRPDTAFLAQLDLMEECVRNGVSAVNWAEAVARSSTMVLQTARYLAVGKASACSRTGFEALLADQRVASNQQWGAMLGLYALHTAEGRFEEVRRLLDSPISGKFGGDLLYLLLTEQGTDLEKSAERVARRIGTTYATHSSPVLWALGHWAVHRADKEGIMAVSRAFTAKSDSTPSRRDSLLASAFAAHAVLAAGDTGSAIRRLFVLRPTATVADIEWQPWEGLGLERLVLARILAARANYALASEVAEQFDTPQPVIYPVYLPASLAIRAQAARALGRPEEAKRLDARLHSLRRNTGTGMSFSNSLSPRSAP